MASTTGKRADRFLPPDPRVEEPYLFTPRMALRVAILGAIALAVFAVLLLRLWSLQVLSGSKYEAAARNNQLRTFPIEAQRGPILDRTGRTLVTNAASTAVDVVPIDLPKQGRYAEMKRLSMVLNVPLPKLLARLEQGMKNPLTPVTMQVAVHPDQVYYLSERNREFPGVQITPTYLRKYNAEASLAHVLGYVGEISPAQLAASKKQYKSCQTTRAQEANVPCPGDRVGQAGVEQSYDKYLRGRSGEKLLRVNSLGGKVGNPVVTRAPSSGFPVRLTIDIGLQRSAERALQYGINLAHQDGHWLANGGAIVAMNPSNGEILAMASSPTYKPSIFVGRTNRKKLAPLLDPETAKKDNYPGLDRVTEGLYPPGSTFKPVTALAAMQERLISPFQTIPCTPSYSVTRLDRQGHAGLQELGPVRRPADDPARGARLLLRHVLLQPRLRVLCPAARPWPSAAGLGEPLRLRRADRDRRRPGAVRPVCRRRSGARRHTRRRPIPATGRSTVCGSPATRSSSRSGRRICWSRRSRWCASTR